jgi:hypothetical protein
LAVIGFHVIEIMLILGVVTLLYLFHKKSLLQCINPICLV